MSDVTARITSMEAQIRQLKKMLAIMLAIVEGNTQVVTRLINKTVPSDEIQEEELFREAYGIFSVTSDPNLDDDLISPNAKRTPIEWSSYFNIVRIDFPLLDKPWKVKNRPAVCLTPPMGRYNSVIVAPITLKTGETLGTDVTLSQAESEFSITGLSKTSRIQLHKLLSISEKRLSTQVGTLSLHWEQKVKEKLCTLLRL